MRKTAGVAGGAVAAFGILVLIVPGCALPSDARRA
jgi:hypothetical protein